MKYNKEMFSTPRMNVSDDIIKKSEVEIKKLYDNNPETQVLGNEKFFELCELAGLTKEQAMTCKSIVVSCEGFGRVNVKVEYSATGEIE